MLNLKHLIIIISFFFASKRAIAQHAQHRKISKNRSNNIPGRNTNNVEENNAKTCVKDCLPVLLIVTGSLAIGSLTAYLFCDKPDCGYILCGCPGKYPLGT